MEALPDPPRPTHHDPIAIALAEDLGPGDLTSRFFVGNQRGKARIFAKEPAIAAGADVFITGEISEPQAHYARETGVAFIAAGHHATERYGVQGVGAQVAQDLGLSWQFIDVDNPA